MNYLPSSSNRKSIFPAPERKYTPEEIKERMKEAEFEYGLLPRYIPLVVPRASKRSSPTVSAWVKNRRWIKAPTETVNEQAHKSVFGQKEPKKSLMMEHLEQAENSKDSDVDRNVGSSDEKRVFGQKNTKKSLMMELLEQAENDNDFERNAESSGEKRVFGQRNTEKSLMMELLEQANDSEISQEVQAEETTEEDGEVKTPETDEDDEVYVITRG